MFLGLFPFSPGGARLLGSPQVPRDARVSLQYEDRHAKWDTNQAGFSHSHQHGFGLLNAWRLVNAAKVIPALPPLPRVGTRPVLVTPWGDTAAVQGQCFGHHPAGPGSGAAFAVRS